jgi:DNA-binding GntR family transcriptional regulator
MGSTFHLDLAALGGNRFVTDAVADALTRLERTRWIEVRTPEARDAAWQEHSDILDAVQAGDADRAAELVAAHVAGTNDRLLGFIAQERRRLRGAGMTIVGAPDQRVPDAATAESPAH